MRNGSAWNAWAARNYSRSWRDPTSSKSCSGTRQPDARDREAAAARGRSPCIRLCGRWCAIGSSPSLICATTLGTRPDLLRVVDYLEWPLEELWNRISRTALLKRPLDEPWQEIHDAIRRLLFRFYYPTTEERVAAHRDAGSFVKVWADKQSGKEQVIGMLDCLWHEAEGLRLTKFQRNGCGAERVGKEICSRHPAVGCVHEKELRDYATSRMMEDEEFQESIRHAEGLIDTLVDIFATAQDT